MVNKKTGIAPDYLHGYSVNEQKRLYDQARFLEDLVFSKLHFESFQRLLEVGCGPGSQTAILLERYPHLQIDGIDAAAKQIKTAKKQHAGAIRKGRLRLQVGDALHLPFKENTFDGAFVCWFLEHVQHPVEILKDIRRVLKSGGTLFCNEVMNAGFYVHPYSPALLNYTFAYNDHQWSLHGDPFVGAKLANYLIDAGYQDISTTLVAEHYDNRMPKRRAQAIDYWTELLLSGAPQLLAAKKISNDLVKQMMAELEILKKQPDSVMLITFMQATARVY